MIIAPATYRDRKAEQHLNILAQQGFSRILSQIGSVERIEDMIQQGTYNEDTIHLVVDRAVIRPGDEENEYCLQDSIQTAFFEGRGECWIDFAGWWGT